MELERSARGFGIDIGNGRGRDWGRGGVRGPYRRPKTEAVVSHHERLSRERQKNKQKT